MDQLMASLLLLGATVTDKKDREIPVFLLTCFGVLAVILQLAGMPWKAATPWSIRFAGDWAAGVAPGLALLLIGKVTREAVGYGDGWTVLVLGMWLGLFPVIEVLFLGLCLAAVYSGWLVLIKKKGWKHQIPFIPFLEAGYLIWLLPRVLGVFQ